MGTYKILFGPLLGEKVWPKSALFKLEPIFGINYNFLFELSVGSVMLESIQTRVGNMVNSQVVAIFIKILITFRSKKHSVIESIIFGQKF